MRKLFFTYVLAYGLFLIAISATAPLFAALQQEWHFSTLLLTVAFATYTAGLLVAMLFLGSLSDYIGRRPVLLAAIIAEIIAMILLAIAPNAWWLVIVRLLQGIATGMTTAVANAGMLDTQPKNRPGFAPFVASLTSMTSLGIGGILAGLAVWAQFWPVQTAFWILALCMVGLFWIIVLLPETGSKKPGWHAAFKPIVVIPASARRAYWAAAPSLLAGWALLGLYLSLGPLAMFDLLGSGNYLIGGLVILLFTAAGAGLSYVLRLRTNSQLFDIGSIVAVIGLFVTGGGIVLSSASVFLAGTLLAGAGFGPAFAGAFRSILSLAPAKQRAGLAAAVYFFAYSALGVPVVIAGIATVWADLRFIVLVYCALAIALYLVTIYLLARNR